MSEQKFITLEVPRCAHCSRPVIFIYDPIKEEYTGFECTECMIQVTDPKQLLIEIRQDEMPMFFRRK